MARRIIVKIAKDGSTKIKAEGTRGKGCQALTSDIEKALGSVKEDVKTSEYYQEGSATTEVTVNS